VFGLAFVVEVVVRYNPFMHKTQPQKLIFLAFCGFFSGSHTQPQPPPQIQTHTKLLEKANLASGSFWVLGYFLFLNLFVLLFEGIHGFIQVYNVFFSCFWVKKMT
jgi:hypothetical protein